MQIPILYVILVLIAIGVLTWLANTYTPMAQPIKTLFNVVVVLLTVVWLCNIFGLFSATMPAIRR